MLREKPAVTFGHSILVSRLHRDLVLQLDPARHWTSVDFSRVRRPGATYLIPDLVVIPVTLSDAFRGRWDALPVYDEPLPLIVEVWSPSPGDYEVDSKFPVYQARGDEEIWRIHPVERTLTAWRRRPDGSYLDSTHHGGRVEIASLPGVTIDLGLLFADQD